MWNRIEWTAGTEGGYLETLGEDMSTSSQCNKGRPRDADSGRDRAGAD
jgi:hypothetical protein